ncbi:MAG: universal stress protein [Nitrosopumilus sp.]|nr:universal stress protein [Nitrosopumilus sp.]MDH3486908.1 universal stress protein [Nitrosopumilus sp.]
MANTVKRFLVPLDGSKNSMRGLDKAISLAKKSETEIIGLHVIEISPSEIKIIKIVLRNALNKNYKNSMKIAKKKCLQNKVPFIDVMEYGKEGERIVSFAAENKCDLIVMGARGLGSIKETFLGSTSNYVLHTSKIPVTIVK